MIPGISGSEKLFLFQDVPSHYALTAVFPYNNGPKFLATDPASIHTAYIIKYHGLKV